MSTRLPDDDPTAARLRDALNAEAALVAPSDDGLATIRAGVGARTGRPWWRHPATPAAAAAVVLALMAGGIAIAFHGKGGNDDVVTGGGRTTSAAPSTGAPSSSAPATSDPAMSTATPTAAPVDQVYVYYLHDDGQGLRLYREQHQETTAGNTPNSGLESLLAARPHDHDYSSPWSSAGPADVQVAGGVATVDLSAWPSFGSAEESIAVQQLVYTVTANDPSVKKVRLLVKGKTPPSGHLDLSRPVPRAPMADVQGWIWLLSPTEGQTVSSPVTITGYGTAFEGTISWDVTRNGAKVAEGHTQGGSNGEFGDFTDTVTLPPGTYEIRAFEASAETGQPVHVDTKTFTVR